MDEIRAALGLVQLSRLDEFNARRAELAALYRRAAGADAGAAAGSGCPATARVSANHILPVLLPAGADRDAVIATLDAAGVQTTVHYPPVHQLTYYRDRWPDLRFR